MPYKPSAIIIGLIFSIALLAGSVSSAIEEEPRWEMPKIVPEEEYGNLIMNRQSEKKGMRPAVFSHWLHRTKYTCRVCHYELEFDMKTNNTDVTEAANRSGRFCGACHNGKIAFAHTEKNCKKCHNGDIRFNREKFKPLKKLPRTKFGNGIDWVSAIENGLIKPENVIVLKPSKLTFNRDMKFVTTGAVYKPAMFSHKVHNVWLDCTNCHPDIFSIEKNFEIHYSMKRNVNMEYCGVCHMSVAFPINDCVRCHKE